MAGTPAYNARVVSTPQILVEGEVWAIIPNSCVIRLVGDAKVRSVSSGGGSVAAVVGVDATNLLAHIKFDVAATPQNLDRVRKVKADMLNGIYVTINLADPDAPFAYQNMVFSKDTEAKLSADGVIPCEFEGEYAA